jgi:hypothetical protein
LKIRIRRLAASSLFLLLASTAMAAGCASQADRGERDDEALGSAQEEATWQCSSACWSVTNVACRNAAGAALNACCTAGGNCTAGCATTYHAAVAQCDAAMPACVAACNGPTCSDGLQNQGEAGVDCGGPCAHACPGSLLWSKAFPGAVSSPVLATDGSGNVLVAGLFSGSIDFGGGPLSSAGASLFLAKLDPAGHHVWSKAFSVENGFFLRVAGIAANAAGEVAIGGDFDSPLPGNDATTTIDFGGGAGYFGTNPGRTGFAAKFDAAGAALQSFPIYPGHHFVTTEGISLDAVGTMCAIGVVTFSPIDEGFVSCDSGLSAPGVFSSWDTMGLAITSTSAGLTFSGAEMGLTDIPFASGPAGHSGGFVVTPGAAFEAPTPIYVLSYDVDEAAPHERLAIDASGHVVLGVSNGCSGFVDGDPFSCSPASFVTRYDATGHLLWSVTGGNGGVAVDELGNVIGTGGVAVPGAQVTKLGPAGDVLWSKSFDPSVSVADPAVDGGNHVFIAGTLGAPANLGGGLLAGGSLYVAKFSP